MSRKFTLLYVLIAIALIIMTGCSSSKVDKTSKEEKKTEETTNIREIKHARGVTKIEGTPERVVILTNEGTEALLALGVKPVGAVDSWTGEPWYPHIAKEMEGVQNLGFETEPNFEAIVDLKPDLIIGNEVRHAEVYDQLSKIAPTIYSEELSGQWKVNFELYAKALNKVDEGKEVLADFDARVEEAKDKIGDKLSTKVSIVRFSAKDVRIYQKDTFSGVLLAQLGMARPASQDVDNFIETVSEETTETMDGDIMFYFLTEESAREIANEWMERPVFKSLEVAKNKQVFEVNETIWNTAGGVKAANLLLDELVERFK